MSVALEVSALSKTYPNGVRALDQVSLQVAAGDFFALLGPNGAGKSTLIGIISSLIRPSAGDVRVYGRSVVRERAAAVAALGLVPQEFNFNQFESPFEIVANQAGYYGLPRARARERAESCLKQLQLWDKRAVPARTLSGGMKRRLMIARAMVHEPRLLILDEPTAGVDIEIRRAMWAFLAEINAAGTTVILTTHYLEEAEQLCRTVAIIDHGRIIEHTRTKHLLEKLDRECFVLDVAGATDALPALADGTLRRVDGHTLELDVPRGVDLGAVFAGLSAAGITVHSLRNKTNRLEELFVRLLAKNGRERAA
jgi:ABC-2 type transport system ATP-binding protein